MSSTMAGGITETGEPYSAFVSVLQNTVLIPFFFQRSKKKSVKSGLSLDFVVARSFVLHIYESKVHLTHF